MKTRVWYTRSLVHSAMKSTGTPLKTTISEHKTAVGTGDVRNPNALHWMRTGRSMDWSGAAVVGKQGEHVYLERSTIQIWGFPLVQCKTP